MKKYFSVLWLFAMTISSLSLVACGSSNDDPVAEKPEEPTITIPTYAKLEVKAIEDIFELGDFIITLEYDNKKETYKLDESTKVADVKFEGIESFSFDRETLPGRVLVIPPFKFETHPVKYTGEFVLSEAGKERIKNAPKEDQIDVCIYAKLQSCLENGTVTIPFNPKDGTALYNGIYVNAFEGFLDRLKEDYLGIFSQKF